MYQLPVARQVHHVMPRGGRGSQQSGSETYTSHTARDITEMLYNLGIDREILSSSPERGGLPKGDSESYTKPGIPKQRDRGYWRRIRMKYLSAQFMDPTALQMQSVGTEISSITTDPNVFS